MTQSHVPELRRFAFAVPLAALFLAAVGCATATPYQKPIADFQIAVNGTIATVQPYLVELNAIETEYQLYTAIKLNTEWGTQHLSAGLDPQQIALRVAALQLVADHARLLAELVSSTAATDVKDAAASFGASAQSLADTVAELSAQGKKIPEFGTPLAQIVALVAEKAIVSMQIEAIETAVLSADQPLSELITILEEDLQTTVRLRRQAIAGITTVRLEFFNEIRKNASPGRMDDLVQQVVELRGRSETIASVDVTALLRDLKSSHKALVQYAKSDKTPTDLASLAVSIDVFAQNVAAVSAIIKSLRQLS